MPGDLSKQELWPPPCLGTVRAVPKYLLSVFVSALPPFLRAVQVTLTSLIYCRFSLEVHQSCTSFSLVFFGTPDNHRSGAWCISHGAPLRTNAFFEFPAKPLYIELSCKLQ